MRTPFKPFTGPWHYQNYTGAYAWIVESRDNGKIKAVIYSDHSNRATIGFIQNWHPLPIPVEYQDVPPSVIKKIQDKWEVMQ